MISFTIIIPTKDRSSLLQAAVGSVIDQKHVYWELIIVNDGAKPVVDFDDKRIKVIHNKGKGRNSARNTGIQAAQNEFICFLDDDDLYQSNFLTSFADFYIKNKYKGILRQGLKYLYDDGRTQKGSLYDPQKYRYQNEYLISEMVGLVTFCFPKSIFETVHLDERFHLWEDTHFLLRLCDKYEFKQINNYGYLYRMHPQMGSKKDMTSERIATSLENNIAPISDYFQNHNTNLPPKLEQKLIAEKTMEYAISDLVYGDGNNAVTWLKNSLNTHFSFSNYKLYYNFLKAYIKNH